jgi:hypothetical protein
MHRQHQRHQPTTGRVLLHRGGSVAAPRRTRAESIYILLCLAALLGLLILALIGANVALALMLL